MNSDVQFTRECKRNHRDVPGWSRGKQGVGEVNVGEGWIWRGMLESVVEGSNSVGDGRFTECAGGCAEERSARLIGSWYRAVTWKD